MALAHHTKTKEGTFRKERGDSLVKNLKKEYPLLNGFNGNMKLGTLRQKYGVDSLDQLLKAIKNEK